MGKILIGTSSWADETLIQSDRFYPASATDAESRLRYYASQFPIVEIDSSYHTLPSEKTALQWVERTPHDFTFDLQAFRIFTQNQADPKSLPRDIHDALPPSLKKKRHLYQKHLPVELLYELWKRFESALLPLHSAGKLGGVLFEFPPWFHVGSNQQEYILSCKEHLGRYQLAVAFRNASWLKRENAQQTFDFLSQNDLSFVAVDEPQGFKSSVPPVVRSTSDIAIVKFHGRNRDTWEKPGAKDSDRFNYAYADDELEKWVPRIKDLASRTRRVHILFNTSFRDRSIVNARKLAGMLEIKLGVQEQLPVD